MSQQTISNGETGLNARNAINANFTELYGALPLPLKLPGMSANTTQAILADALIVVISVSWVSGSATLRIGITPNGQELLDDTVIADTSAGRFIKIQVDQFFQNAGSVYFTFSGTAGQVNVRMDILNNYF